MCKSFIKTIIFSIFMVIIGSSELYAQAPIKFEVSFKEPQAHYVEVQMEIKDVSKDYIDVKMPVWAPGSYLVREFSKNVEGFRAKTVSGGELGVQKMTKNTWRITTGKEKTVLVNYRVYAFEVSVRTSFVDASHAFLSPTGIFMYPDGQVKRPAEVTIKPFKTWSRVSTGLTPVDQKQFTYTATDFDVLFDSPIEVGNQDVFNFTAAGVNHEVAMYGGGNYDKERLSADMAKIVESATAVFGENPNEHYVFIVHNYQSGGGGLEHLNSTVLGASRFAYGTENGYKSFLSLVAHEYFHLWNIKRLRPVTLGPFDYDKENYTTDLWIGEGFTAYYDNLLVRRAGFYTEDAYLQLLASDIAAVENRPGNLVQPLSESSFDAWIKYYRQDENSVNSIVSYYNKGALMAMMMDLKILKATNGEKGLDDVMKAAYNEFYKKRAKGFTDQEFKSIAEKVAGISLDDVYEMVNSASSPDYNKYLQLVGAELSDLNKGYEIPDLGIKTTISDGKLTVQNVYRGSGAWEGGLNVKDELIGINGYRIDIAGKELERTIQASKIEDVVKILVARDGVLKELDIKLGTNKSGKYLIKFIDNPLPEQSKLKDKWLH
ncbi:Predicted metalloprotease, contains C-terminal PDZ domain [Olivibacter domesticus]|uniref:Predicted metalloprotease, contains C-terminal PDZ domain n=2 Tax=Olivibacter domesticus TaxID=407022 RepID=A0A1H7ZPP3_OLID1|nr:Predicted metalloprotease, contains C-terminal PDZ domain [Olivibacter domesticus]